MCIMLYKDDVYDSVLDPFDVLNESIYLTIDESTIYSDMIPIIENSRLNTYLTESTYNHIPNTTVILDESDIIEDPTIIQDYTDYVIRPISKRNPQYVFVETCCILWLQEAFDPHKYTSSEPENWGGQGTLSKALGGIHAIVGSTKQNPNYITDADIKNFFQPLEQLIGPIDYNKIDKQKVIKSIINTGGWIGNLKDGSIANLLGYSAKKTSPIPPFLQKFIQSTSQQPIPTTPPVQPQQSTTDKPKLHFSISSILKRKYNINPKDKNAIITKRQKMTDALTDLKELFGEKFDQTKIDAKVLVKSLNKFHHVSNFSDETLFSILGSNPFESEYQGEKAPWEIEQPKERKRNTSLEDQIGKPAESAPNRDITSSNQEPLTTRQIDNTSSYFQRAKNFTLANKKKIGVGVALGLGAAGLYKYISYKLDQKPKSVIAKRIAALRGVYHTWMKKAFNSKHSNVIKRAAAILLQVIDMLLEKLQTGTENIYRAVYKMKRRSSYAI